MNKQNFALLLLILVLLPLSAQDKPVSVVGYWCDRDTLSNDVGQWIEFRSDMTYVVYSNTPFGSSVQGAYQVQGNRIITYPEMESFSTEMESIEYAPADLTGFAREWTLYTDAEEMTCYKRRIEGEAGAVFWDRTSFADTGRQKRINDIPMVTVGKASCFVNSNTNIRTGPGLGYDKLEISKSSVPFPYLPKDSKVILIGRSLVKESIDGMNDYWYYVDLKLHPIEDSGPDFAWVYGGLLDRSTLEAFDPMIHR